jgi:hypothetical protein
VAFSLAAFALTNSWWAVFVGGLLFAGDAMYSYVYERRLSTLRLHAGFTGRIKHSETGVYERGTPFRALTRDQRIRTVTGQLKQYKSIYPVILASYISPIVLLGGLAALALFKHWRWISLVARTLHEVRPGDGKLPSAAAEAETPVTAAGGAQI